MPKELATSCEKYKRFYLNQHSGHKLEWRYDSGQAEITVDFAPTCRKALVVSTYQMMVLLVFNSFKRVTYKQMLDVTGIPKSEIANHLLSLCHPKVAVLLKRTNTHAHTMLSVPFCVWRALSCSVLLLFFQVPIRRSWRTRISS